MTVTNVKLGNETHARVHSEVARLLNVHKEQDVIYINAVDYWKDNDTEPEEVTGSIVASVLLEQLAMPKLSNYLDILGRIFALDIDDDLKFDAIIGQTPAMYDEGVLGVTLDIE